MCVADKDSNELLDLVRENKEDMEISWSDFHVFFHA